MSKNKGIWEDIGISNDFLFGKIMTNPEICKEICLRDPAITKV